MIGWEAFLTLRLHEEAGEVLEEPAAEALAEYIDRMDAGALLEAMRRISERLKSLTGFGPDQAPGAEPERLVITKNLRILLPGRYDTEIRMRPLVKTVFLLFLKHPEGIRFRELETYREEMLALYGKISRRGDRASQEHSIDLLLRPDDNSIHEKVSVLTRTLSRYFKGPEIGFYNLSGPPGAPKRIPLDRYYVEWK